MSNKYLGEFTSIGAVWSKYPEGGKPNDFLTVNGVRYTWSVQLNSWITPNQMQERGWGADNVNGDLYIENDLRVGGTVYANNIRHPYKGLFGSLEQLQRYYPNPKPGDFADVGYTSPSTRYACEVKHEWTDTGQEGVDPSVILPPELSDMELISRWGYVDDDARLTVNFSQRKVSWGESSVHFGKLKKVDIQQGEHLAQSSMSSSEKVGYLVFDKVEKIFNYYTPSTVPPTTDDIVLIAVFIDKKVSFSTSLIFDEDGNGISPLQIVDKTIGTPEDEANAAGTIFSRIAFLANEIGERDEAPDIVGKIFGRLNYLTPISRKTFNLTLIESLTDLSSVEDVMAAFTPENFDVATVPDCGDYLLGKVNPIDRNTQKAVVQNVSYSSDLTRRIQIAYNIGYGTTVVTINSQWQFISKKRFGLPNFAAESDVANAQLTDFDGNNINPKSLATNVKMADGKSVEAKFGETTAYVDDAVKRVDNEVAALQKGVTPEMLSKETVDLINASGGGTVNNQADGEDLAKKVTEGGAEVISFADKTYAPARFSGLARKYLRKNVSGDVNVLTQDMVNEANTIYHIQYDYDLQGATITIPSNCILLFEGGKLTNGEIAGDGTSVIKNYIDDRTLFVNKIGFCEKLNTQVLNVLSLSGVKWNGFEISLSDKIIFDGNILGKVLNIDFDKFKFNVTNKQESGGMVEFKNFDFLTIRNAWFKGDKITDDGRIYNTDSLYSFLNIHDCKTTELHCVTVSDVRGNAISLNNDERVIINNCYISRATYSLIQATENVDNAIVSNCTLIGVGNQGSQELNYGLGAGVSLNAGTYAAVYGCNIYNIPDTAIQINGYVYSFVENNHIRSFGKDGAKIMRSTVFESYGSNVYGIIRNNIVEDKFLGKEDGSCYLLISDTQNAIVEGNITRNNSNNDDANWMSFIGTIIDSPLTDTKISVNNNLFHKSALLYRFNDIAFCDNNVSGYLKLASYDTSERPDDVRRLKIQDNTIIANDSLTFAINIAAKAKFIEIDRNIIESKKGHAVNLQHVDSEMDIYLSNNKVYAYYHLVNGQMNVSSNLAKLAIVGNDVNSMQVATGSYSTVVLSNVTVDNLTIEGNSFNGVRTITSPIDGSEAFVNNLKCQNNTTNGINSICDASRMIDKIGRLLGTPLITSTSATIFEPKNPQKGDSYKLLFTGEYVNVLFDGEKFISTSTITHSNTLAIKYLRKITEDFKVQIYNGTSWVDATGATV